MSKINIDKDKIKIYILPGITESLNQINRVIMRTNYNNVPKDLPCRADYLQYKEEMSQLQKELSEVNKWLINSVKKYDAFSNRVYDNIKLLPKSRVPARTAILK